MLRGWSGKYRKARTLQLSFICEVFFNREITKESPHLDGLSAGNILLPQIGIREGRVEAGPAFPCRVRVVHLEEHQLVLPHLGEVEPSVLGRVLGVEEVLRDSVVFTIPLNYMDENRS